MKYLKVFELFIEYSNRKQNPNYKSQKKAPIIYSDDNLIIRVVKTLDTSIKHSDPEWCSTHKFGFYKHNLTANMYRFDFKDGFKLRLTWSYKKDNTTWGSGGTLNDQKVQYLTIKPRDEKNPFYFDYSKDDDRQIMIDRIKEIPQKAIDSVLKYQEKNKIEKDALSKSISKEVNKIKIENVTYDSNNDSFNVTLDYLNKKYKIIKLKGYFRFYKTPFEKDFKNRYAFMENNILDEYLNRESDNWLMKNNTKLISKFRGWNLV